MPSAIRSFKNWIFRPRASFSISMMDLFSTAARIWRRLVTPGRSGEEYISGIESVTAREMILRTSLGGVVRRILEYFSWSDFDIFLEGLVKLATRGYLPIRQTLFHESMGPTSVS